MPSHVEEYKYNEDIKTIKEIEFLIFGDRAKFTKYLMVGKKDDSNSIIYRETYNSNKYNNTF